MEHEERSSGNLITKSAALLEGFVRDSSFFACFKGIGSVRTVRNRTDEIVCELAHVLMASVGKEWKPGKEGEGTEEGYEWKTE